MLAGCFPFYDLFNFVSPYVKWREILNSHSLGKNLRRLLMLSTHKQCRITKNISFLFVFIYLTVSEGLLVIILIGNMKNIMKNQPSLLWLILHNVQFGLLLQLIDLGLHIICGVLYSDPINSLAHFLCHSRLQELVSLLQQWHRPEPHCVLQVGMVAPLPGVPCLLWLGEQVHPQETSAQAWGPQPVYATASSLFVCLFMKHLWCPVSIPLLPGLFSFNLFIYCMEVLNSFSLL